MASETRPLSRAAVTGRHRERRVGDLAVCVRCGQHWPCDAARLLDERDALKAAVARLAGEDRRVKAEAAALKQDLAGLLGDYQGKERHGTAWNAGWEQCAREWVMPVLDRILAGADDPDGVVATLEREMGENLRLHDEVARLAGEIDGWRERNLAYANRLATAESERDAARAALVGLIEDAQHFAHHGHRLAHDADPPDWRSCGRGVCPGLRRALERARAAQGLPPYVAPAADSAVARARAATGGGEPCPS